MKIIKHLVVATEVLCALGILWCVCRLCIMGGTKAEDILSAVEIDLPNYEITSEDNNLDRGASSFDWFQYTVSFSPQNSDLIDKLNKDNWKKKNDDYWKSVEVDEDLSYSAHVNPAKGTAQLKVEIDELYGIIDLTIIFILIFISLLVGTIYGTTWLVVKYKKKKIEPQDV